MSIKFCALLSLLSFLSGSLLVSTPPANRFIEKIMSRFSNRNGRRSTAHQATLEALADLCLQLEEDLKQKIHELNLACARGDISVSEHQQLQTLWERYQSTAQTDSQQDRFRALQEVSSHSLHALLRLKDEQFQSLQDENTRLKDRIRALEGELATAGDRVLIEKKHPGLVYSLQTLLGYIGSGTSLLRMEGGMDDLEESLKVLEKELRNTGLCISRDPSAHAECFRTISDPEAQTSIVTLPALLRNGIVALPGEVLVPRDKETQAASFSMDPFDITQD